jgi:hypothetical protein
VFGRFTGPAPFVETELDPFLEILDAVAADAEFYEIESHGRNLAAGLPAFNDQPSFAQPGSFSP